tara:strand:- start:1374 stop:1616 length:243 start_codon:yes stop_codon:yes gene_type:complete
LENNKIKDQATKDKTMTAKTEKQLFAYTKSLQSKTKEELKDLVKSWKKLFAEHTEAGREATAFKCLRFGLAAWDELQTRR